MKVYSVIFILSMSLVLNAFSAKTQSELQDLNSSSRAKLISMEIDSKITDATMETTMTSNATAVKGTDKVMKSIEEQ